MIDQTESTIIEPKADRQFIVTPLIQSLVDYSLAYLKAGMPLHYTGPAGVGKSSLAMYVACQLGRPIVVIHGDEGYVTSDLVGGEHGYRAFRLRDQFIHTVVKTEEQVNRTWVDNRLTLACKHGFTLIYDEFTRSRPEANNALLSVLEEGMLDLPTAAGEGGYLQVHPQFRTILTSNPAEYAGVFTVQDALRDRLVSINVGRYDEETESAIVRSRTGIPDALARRIVGVARSFTAEQEKKPRHHTLRPSLKIARILAAQNGRATEEAFFRTVCLHVLSGENYFQASLDPQARAAADVLQKTLEAKPEVRDRIAPASLPAKALPRPVERSETRTHVSARRETKRR